MIDRWFREHPRSVGESYGEHLRAAGGFGFVMVTAGLACMIHGLLPKLFERTGSSAVDRLHDRMIRNRSGRTASADTDTMAARAHEAAR